MKGTLQSNSIRAAFAFTKSDTVNLEDDPANTNGHTGVFSIYVGGTGNVVVVFEDNSTATFLGVPAGTILPVAAKRVNAATTATNMLACVVQQ